MTDPDQDQGEGGGAFPEGSTAVRRDVTRGRVWTAAATRVVRDTGDDLVLACWPGAELMSPTTWIAWLLHGDDRVRKQAIPNLATGRWELAPWIWRDTTLLGRSHAGDYFSVLRYFDAEGRAGGWYVNFELPFRRTRIGIDTFDLLLDLVVDPDLSGHTWKDEDEYAHARRLGVIGDAVHKRVERARQQVLGLIEAREGAFAEDWSDWRRDPAWPAPTLPPNALTLPVTNLL